MSIEQAKQVLKDAGYFVDNLWQVIDVTDNYECSEQIAKIILEEALTNDVTMNQIWYSISYKAEELGLKNKTL